MSISRLKFKYNLSFPVSTYMLISFPDPHMILMAIFRFKCRVNLIAADRYEGWLFAAPRRGNGRSPRPRSQRPKKLRPTATRQTCVCVARGLFGKKTVQSMLANMLKIAWAR